MSSITLSRPLTSAHVGAHTRTLSFTQTGKIVTAALAVTITRAMAVTLGAAEKTLQRWLDAIVWEWDNPYVGPGGWTPLEE